jgi:hypothetical protein
LVYHRDVVLQLQNLRVTLLRFAVTVGAATVALQYSVGPSWKL